MFPNYRAKGHVSTDISNGIVKRVTALTIQKFGNTISTSLDSIVVSTFIGLTAVAVYGNYFYIVSSLIAFIGGGIASAAASIGNSLVTETVEKNYDIFKKINMLNQWCLIWSIPCLSTLYQRFMRIWVGESLMEDSLFVCLMVVYFYLAETRKVVQTYKDAAGMWWADKWKPLVGCIVNFTFNIISVQFIGMHGVILSTIISYLFIEIPWETMVLFRQYFEGYLKKYIRQLVQCFGCIVLTTAIGLILGNMITLSGILGFLIAGIVCFVESNVVFIILFRKSHEFISLVEIIKNMAKNKREYRKL
jgi:O-antigen/teichoic acid export membrane protein